MSTFTLSVGRSLASIEPGWRTRFAPAPTGWLHVGHVVNAVFVWGIARAHGGRVVLRMEDHDRGRCRPEYEQGVLDDLAWLGLEADIGHPSENGRDAGLFRQSARGDAYVRALGLLAGVRNRVYPCACSRRDIARIAPGDTAAMNAPNGTAEIRYPGTCRSRDVPEASTPARRVVMDPGAESFNDVLCGPQHQDPSAQCGDVLVRDRAGNWTYQFAVVVDDIAQNIDVVIRGEDLLASTGRQIRLARLLGRATPPLFMHHALITKPGGAKLSKSDGDTGIRDLRASGWTAQRVLGEAAHMAGVLRVAQSLHATDLGALFAVR